MMHALRFCVLSALLFSALATPVRAQQTLLRVDGTAPAEWLGLIGFVVVGDVDGDGTEDFVSGSQFGPFPLALPYVRAYSGATGATLWTLVDPCLPCAFAQWIQGGGDVDGDGFRDVLVGASLYDSGSLNYEGAVFIVSGATGLVIRTHLGVGSTGTHRHPPGAIVGDTNGDGYGDYVISDHPASHAIGIGYLHSGIDGQLIRVVATNVSNRPEWVTGMGDVDADGFDDMLVCVTGCGPHVTCAGTVQAYSGRTGQLLYEVFGDALQQGLGLTGTTSAGGDLNGDGVPDFVLAGDVYNSSTNQGRGTVRAYSGVDGSELWTQVGDTPNDRLGRSLTMGEDWNGDGCQDVLAYYTNLVGNIRVLSGHDGATLADFASTPNYLFGDRLHVGIDLDGDGVRDPLTFGKIPIPWPNQLTNNGSILGLKLASGPGAYRQHHGAACPTSTGTLPHMILAQDPGFGQIARFRLRAGAPSNTAVLLLGARIPGGNDMTALGAPGCTLHVDPFAYVPFAIDVDGMCRLDVFVPSVPSLAGLPLEAQWLVGDSQANPGGAVTSTSVSMRLGM